MQRIYYAHAMSWYDTEGEREDVAKLAGQGEVVNPNTEWFERRVRDYQRRGYPVMDLFAQYIRDDADIVAFRRLNNGKITAGVAREIFEAIIWGKLVWEIFSSTARGGPFIDMNVLGTRNQFDIAPAIDFNDILTVAETKAAIARGEL